MIECPKCQQQHGRKLRQCPNCGYQTTADGTTQKTKQLRSAYYQFIKESLQRPMTHTWQWANLKFGWLTFGLLILINAATVSLLVASWTQQSGAIAGTSTTYIILRQPTAQWPTNLALFGVQILSLGILIGGGYLLQRFGLGQRQLMVSRYLVAIANYGALSLPVALVALVSAWFAGMSAILLIGILGGFSYLILNIAVVVNLFKTPTPQFDPVYGVLLYEIMIHLALLVGLGQMGLRVLRQLF